MDFLDRVIDSIENKFNMKSGTISIDILKDKSPAVAVMIPPTTPTNFYIDKTIQHNIVVVVKTKDKSQSEAINRCTDFVNYLSSINSLLSLDNSFEFVGSNIYSNVAFISKTEKDDFIYSGSVLMQIYT